MSVCLLRLLIHCCFISMRSFWGCSVMTRHLVKMFQATSSSFQKASKGKDHPSTISCRAFPIGSFSSGRIGSLTSHPSCGAAEVQKPLHVADGLPHVPWWAGILESLDWDSTQS